MKRADGGFLLMVLALAACSSPPPTPPPTIPPATTTLTSAPPIVQIEPTRPTYTALPWPTSTGPQQPEPFPTPRVRLIPEPGTIYFELPQPETRNYALIRVNSDGSGYETVLEADSFLVSAETRKVVYLRAGSRTNPIPDRLMLANLDGSDPRMIFEAPTRHEILWNNVVWSPDGRTIAVPTTIEDDVFPQRDTSISIIPIDGSATQLIYKAPEPHDIEFLSWSPDSSALVVIQSVLDPRADYYYSLSTELAVVTPDAAPLKVLFSSEEYLISSAAWSPDSRQLAYSIWLHDGTLGTRASEGISRINVDGTEPAQVTSGWDTLGVWSPDGDYLYFRRVVETARSSIFRTRLDGTFQKPVSPPMRHAGLPQWSPNGTMLAFPADNVKHEGITPFEAIFTLRSLGEGLQQIVDGPVLGMVWSPSSRQIAVARVTHYGDWAPCGKILFVMNADGSGATPLTGEMGCFTLLAWVK